MSNKEIHRLNLAIASCLVSVLSCFLALSLPSKFLLSLSPVYTLFKIQTLGSYPLHYGEYMLKRSNRIHVYGILFRKLGKYFRNKLNIEEIMRMHNFLLLIISKLKLNKFVRMLIGLF